MSNCNCQTTQHNVSGGTPLMPHDFSDHVEIHFQYSNWDEISLFSCKDCDRSWLLVNRFTDRPPYIGKAFGIGPKGIEKLMLKASEIEKAGLSALPSQYK